MIDEISIIPDTVDIHDNADIINSSFEGHNFVGKSALVTYSSLGKYSYVSRNSVIKTTDVGRFTSISWNCSIGPEEHDFRRLTAHSILTSTKQFRFFDKKFYNPFNKCFIGNDVWIGCNSVVLGGVRIADGAVVGANSVVTKDVPPYAIVVGNPAKILKYRFTDNVISELLKIQWWNLSDEKIKDLYDIFAISPLGMKEIELLKLKIYGK